MEKWQRRYHCALLVGFVVDVSCCHAYVVLGNQCIPRVNTCATTWPSVGLIWRTELLIRNNTCQYTIVLDSTKLDDSGSV